MATRAQVGGSTATQYEDFQPKTEWQEEEKTYILHVHLPNFLKEQIKISCIQATHIIRVVGERQITRNKWSRFNQPVNVPENGDVNKIHAKFQNGVLSVTIPKLTTVTQASPREEAKATWQEAPTPPKSITSPTRIGKEGNEKIMTSQKPTIEPKAQKSMEETTRLASQKQMDGQKVEAPSSIPQEAPKEPKPRKRLDEGASKIASTFDAVKQKDEKKNAESNDKLVSQKISEKKQNGEAIEKPTEPAKEKNLLDQDWEISKKRQESVETETKETSKKTKALMVPGHESPAVTKTSENERRKKSSGTSKEKSTEDVIAQGLEDVKNTASAAKKSVEGLTMELSQEWKSLVNMGVAVLMIVALVAYISSTYGSSRSTRN